MLEIAAELALDRPAYVDMALKFVEHFLWIASSMMHAGEDVGMWDEEDGFFYDVLRLPDGRAQRLKVRSMVGLLPLCAVTVFEGELLTKYPESHERLRQVPRGPPGADGRSSTIRPSRAMAGRRLAAILDETEASPGAGDDAGRAGVPQPLRHPRPVALSRGASLRVPRGGPGVPGVVPAGGVRHRHVRRQLQLARADLDARERPDHPGAAAVPHLLRRRLSPSNARPAPADG